jgi:uncharacterized protein (DUF58 family)
MKKSELFLDPELMGSLEQLEYVVRRLLAGRMRGERRSRRKGIGSEFADYRDYVQGDDLRFIDWNIFGRLDRLFLKLFLEEEDLSVSVYLDKSESMKFGDPPKFRYAQKLAAALAYVGLVNLDRTSIEAHSSAGTEVMPVRRGKMNLNRVLDFLDQQEPGGETDLEAGLKAFSLRHPPNGYKIIISDFLEKSGYENALKWTQRGTSEVIVLQVLSPQEVKPEIVGDLTLLDCEDGALQEVSITSGLLKRYQQNLQALCGGLRDYCKTRGLVYFFVQSKAPLAPLILTSLRQRGVLK